MVSKPKIYVSMNGDFPNIGDALIRRLAFDWVRGRDGAAVYVANAPDMWLDQINVAPADTVVRGRANFWTWAKLVARAPKGSVLLLEPGEVILDRASFRKEAGLLALAALTRLKGGEVILPPRAAVRPSRATLTAHRALCRISQVALWREESSLRVVGVGKRSPDIAFSAGIRDGLEFEERDSLVVSLRGHRAAPDDTWLTAVRAFAERENLRIVVVAQVQGDEARAAQLAQALGGVHLSWPEKGDIEHEQRLRELYDRTKLVISDRLHVLILASLSGAIPAEIVVSPAPKVRAHFEQIGFMGASRDVTSNSSDEIVEYLTEQIGRSEELRGSVKAADSELRTIRQAVRSRITPRTPGDRSE